MGMSNVDYRAAMKQQRERREAAQAKNRSRKIERRPWVVLMEGWHEEMKGAFGRGHDGILYEPVSWGEAEKALARKLIAEVGFDDALEMMRRFVRTWEAKSRSGTPGFKLLWHLRDGLRAELRGQTQTKKDRVNRDEFNAERADRCPDIGW